MMNTADTGGWERLSNGFDVEFTHGIPVRVSDNGRQLSIPESNLAEEIGKLANLSVRLGEWRQSEDSGEREAPVLVSRTQLDEVLRRLALAAAAQYFDRFRKAIDTEDVDWDELEYNTDFATALACCGLERHEIDKDEHREHYVDVIHRETRRLAELEETPIVEPEP